MTSTRKPSLSVIIPATNPLTSQFEVFFSCVASWSRIADEVIVVDGGTTDGTYQVLSEYATGWRHVSTAETQWPVGRHFHGLQFAVNLNAAMSSASGDWVILAHADYVAANDDSNQLRTALTQQNQPVVGFRRFKVNVAAAVATSDWRGVIINRRLVNDNARGKPLRFGASHTSRTVSDFPLWCSERSSYQHPTSDAIVEVFAGVEAVDGPRIEPAALECCVLDHFFYTAAQVERQGQLFYEYYGARHLGTASMRRTEIRRIKKLGSISGYHQLADVENCSLLPRVFRDDVRSWWRDECYGAARREHPEGGSTMVERSRRRMRSALLRSLGLRGVHESHSWVGIDDELLKPLDVIGVWRSQTQLVERYPQWLSQYVAAGQTNSTASSSVEGAL